MKIVKIPKRGGGHRTIYVPSRAEAKRFRDRLERLRVPHRIVCAVRTVVHGFAEGCSPMTMARLHVGRGFTLSMDLAGWYDSVSASQIAYGLETEQAVRTLTQLDGPSMTRAEIVSLAALCVWDGAPRQGLPSSPLAANLAGAQMDAMILVDLPRGVVYTRYADDLVFSADDLGALLAVRDYLVPAAVAAMGWRISGRKTRIQDARHGRRIICGIAVGAVDLRAPRSTRRRERAIRASAKNRRDLRRAAGLREWIRAVGRGSDPQHRPGLTPATGRTGHPGTASATPSRPPR